MLDPYAPVAVKVQLPEGINVPPPKKGLATIDPQINAPALMGCLSSLIDSFDWEGSLSPGTPLRKTLVLEIDVPSFSGNTSVSASRRGESITECNPNKSCWQRQADTVFDVFNRESTLGRNGRLYNIINFGIHSVRAASESDTVLVLGPLLTRSWFLDRLCCFLMQFARRLMFPHALMQASSWGF
jgi:hypothetical protein